MQPTNPRSTTAGWLAAILVVAAVLRIVVLLELRDDPLFHHPRIDQRDYIEWGQWIASSDPLTALREVQGQPVAYPRPPGTAYVLGMLFRLFGDGLWSMRLLQVLLSVATVGLVFRMGRAWFSERVGLAAAAVVALHGVLIHATTEIMPTTWVVFLDTLGLVLLARGTRRALLGGGLALGVSAWFTPTVLLFVPFALVGVVAARVNGARTAIAALLAGVTLAVLPVTLRNVLVSGEVVLVSANGGINLWIGNNPDYHRTVAIRPGRDYQLLEAEPLLEGGIPASRQGAHSAYFVRKTLDFLRHHPLEAAGLWVRKALLFWNGAEIPRSSDIYLARERSRVLAALVWPAPARVPDGLLLPLALAGIALALGAPARRRALAVPLGFVTSQVLLAAMFFVCSRYRAPALPVLALFAVSGAGCLAAAWRFASPVRRAAGGAILAGLLVAANVTPREARLDLREEETLFRGLAAYESNALDVAQDRFAAALRMNPQDSDAWLFLGHTLERTGQLEAALRAWRRAAAADPADMRALRNVARVLERRGDLAGAIAALEQNLAHAGDRTSFANDYTVEWKRLAQLHAARGDLDAARDALTRALLLRPGDTEARALLQQWSRP